MNKLRVSKRKGEITREDVERLLNDAACARYRVRNEDRDAVIEFIDKEIPTILRDLGFDPRLLEIGLGWVRTSYQSHLTVPRVTLTKLDAVSALSKVAP